MAEYLTKTEHLTAVADAIRAKGGTSDPMVYPDGFVSAIQAIPSGGSDGVLNGILDGGISGAYSNSDIRQLRKYALAYCSNLTDVDFPNVRTASSYCLAYCDNLKNANFPSVVSGEMGMFHYCTNLLNPTLPVLNAVRDSCFRGCSKLSKIDFPKVKSIANYAFYTCTSLTALILRYADSVVTLSTTSAFKSSGVTAGTGYIYVPSALVESYKTATNWSTYADQIRAIEDYPDITGGAT